MINKIPKEIITTKTEEYFDIRLSEMENENLKDLVKQSLVIIQSFLREGRKLGFIETIRNQNSDAIFPGINEEQHLMDRKFREVRDYVESKIKSN